LGCHSLKEVHYGGSMLFWMIMKTEQNGNEKLNGSKNERAKIVYNSKYTNGQ
jgi:hypothetical protein